MNVNVAGFWPGAFGARLASMGLSPNVVYVRVPKDMRIPPLRSAV